MTLRHLEIFAAVADHGTMSGAARALYIAQPTVSQAVAELESGSQHHCQQIEITLPAQNLRQFIQFPLIRRNLPSVLPQIHNVI